jgi:hypothetical protein
MPKFKISQILKSQSNESLPCQLEEIHFGRYSCPCSKAPKDRISQSNERFPHQSKESHFRGYSCPCSKSLEAQSPEVKRCCHVKREKVTSRDFHPRIPKSQSDVRFPCRFKPYNSMSVFQLKSWFSSISSCDML